jgi:hypothetical protein
VRFDAQCDLAAIVYGGDDDPDRLLMAFAEDLRRAGHRPIGTIQVGRSCRAVNPGLGAVVLPGGENVPLTQGHEAHDQEPHRHDAHDHQASAECRLNSARLAGLARQLAVEIEDGADLVIINRFGWSEAEGGGLTDLIARALDADIPVLIAVPERRFGTLIRFCDGMNVRLPCRRDALDRWWRTVAGSPAPRRGADTFCEVTK